jgi:hypothetical protein
LLRLILEERCLRPDFVSGRFHLGSRLVQDLANLRQIALAHGAMGLARFLGEARRDGARILSSRQMVER